MNIERLGEARDMAPWEVLQTAPFARAASLQGHGLRLTQIQLS